MPGDKDRKDSRALDIVEALFMTLLSISIVIKSLRTLRIPIASVTVSVRKN